MDDFELVKNDFHTFRKIFSKEKHLSLIAVFLKNDCLN